MKNIAFIVGLIVVLNGCASFSPPWNKYSINNTQEPIRSYELEKKYKVSVGEVIVSAHKSAIETYYKPIVNDAIIWRGSSINSFNNDSENNIWLPEFEYDGADGDYILTSDAFYHGVIGIITKDNGTVPPNPVLRLDGKGSTKRHPVKNMPESNLLFDKFTQFKKDSRNFKFELIYTGKTNNTISIVYREYVNDFARDSFYQNLTYDLNESNLIKFKSIELEVLESSNSELIFKVLKDGGLKWI